MLVNGRVPPNSSYLGALCAAIGVTVAASKGCASGSAAEQSVPASAGQAGQVAPAPRDLVRASVGPSLVRMPGGREAIAISVTVAPQWHIYWRNPGDSGAAPSVRLELPEGWSAGALEYPRPEIFGDADERTFGYSGTVCLLVPVTRPSGWQGPLEVGGEMAWLACRTSCIAGRSPLSAKVSADSASAPDAPAGRTWPSAMPAGSAVRVVGEGSSRDLEIAVAGAGDAAAVQFIPEDCRGIRWRDGVGPHALAREASTGHWTLRTPISVAAGDAAGGALRVRGLVMIGKESSSPAYFVDIAVPTAPTLTDP